MKRARSSSSDSSSWSLVDVESLSGDSDTESLRDQDVLVASEVELSEDDELGGPEHPSHQQQEHSLIVEELDVNDDDDENESVEGDEELELEALQEDEMRESGTDSEVEREDSDIEDESDVTDEEENDEESPDALEDLTEEAQHLYTDKLDVLSQASDTPFDHFLKWLLCEDGNKNARYLSFLLVLLTTLVGAFCGQYIGACLIGNRPLALVGDDSFCLESERAHFVAVRETSEHPGLQYREPVAPSPLQQCQQRLEDKTAEVAMKSGVTRFIRESYRVQLERTRQEFEARLALYKRASRRQFAATKHTSSSSQPPETQKQTAEDLCPLQERRIANLTRSLFLSLSNWTTHTPLVQNLMSFSPKFDRSLERVSSWLRRSNVLDRVSAFGRDALPRLPAALGAASRKMRDFVRTSDLRSYAHRMTTALTKRNFSTVVAEYTKPVVRRFEKHVRSALMRLSELKSQAEVCFAHRTCEAGERLARALDKSAVFRKAVGAGAAHEYLAFLRSLATNNCSTVMACERDWWTGCGPQFLENCALRGWQQARQVTPVQLLHHEASLKLALAELRWVQSRRPYVRCRHLTVVPRFPPAPCVADPTPGPCNAAQHQPCVQGSPSKAVSRPSVCRPTTETAKPVLDWSARRAAVRAQRRKSSAARGAKKPFGVFSWEAQRAAVRAQQRSARAGSAKSSKKLTPPPRKRRHF